MRAARRSDIVAAVERQAGRSEKVGPTLRRQPSVWPAIIEQAWEVARADLLVGRKVIVNADRPNTDREALAKVESFWRSLGADVLEMTAVRSMTRALAATSHLPHLVAFAFGGCHRRKICSPWRRAVGGIQPRIAGGEPQYVATDFSPLNRAGSARRRFGRF